MNIPVEKSVHESKEPYVRKYSFIPRFGVALTLLFVFYGGCSPQYFRANKDNASTMLHLLNESDNGRTVTIRTAESLRITLPENATTGYRWELERWNREVIGLVAEAPQYASGPLVGSGGHVDFQFQARKPGTSDIALKELRPWEGESSVIARYRLHVEVLP